MIVINSRRLAGSLENAWVRRSSQPLGLDPSLPLLSVIKPLVLLAVGIGKTQGRQYLSL
jgi:hypothetical protein